MSGKLWHWGGALYSPASAPDATPVQLGTHEDIASVSARNGHALYIRDDGSFGAGTLWAVGANGSGQLGIGSTTAQDAPVQVGTSNEWYSVSAGLYQSSAAIDINGQLWVWGYNSTSKVLGLTDSTNRTSPTQIDAGTNWDKVVVGMYHMLALKTDGTLWSWGSNQYGQGGQGDNTTRAVPTQVGTDTDWTEISAGSYFSAAKKSGGTWWLWGLNASRQLGDGTTTNSLVPLQITGTWSKIFCGGSAAFGIKSDGTLWAWGVAANASEFLSAGTATLTTPTQIDAGTTWFSINPGTKFISGSYLSGAQYLWGRNDYHQIDDTATAFISTPTAARYPAAEVVATMTDAVLAIAAPPPEYGEDVGEWGATTDAVSLSATSAPFSVADSFDATDALWDQNELLIDAPSITDATETDWYHAMSDAPTVADEFAQSTTRTRTLDDSANATDGTAQQFDVVLADSAAATDALSEHIEAAPVSDSAAASDAIECNTASVSTLADGASTNDLASAVTVDLVAESVSATDATVSDAAVLVADTAAATDSLSDSVDSDDSAIADVVTAVDECQIQVVSNMVAADTVAAAETLSHKQPGLIAWVMNTETGAPSWHSNYGFLDLAQSGGVTYAVGPDGFSILGADTDDGDTIDAGITYGFSEFGGYDSQGNPKPDERKKRVDAFWFGYTSDDVLEVSVETYGQGLPSYTYTMPARQAERPINNRIQPGKGLHARYWRIGIDNVGGCAFEIKSLSADVLPGTRRL